MRHTANSHRPAPAGFSLIELLVAMAIGLVVTLVITNVLLRSENEKRTSTSLNDTIQSGAYTGYLFERAIRQAGTGYTQRLSQLFGCRLNAWNTREGGIILPSPAAFLSPFGNASTQRRLAPVLIEKDAANTGAEVRGDVITVMSGAGGKSEMPIRATAFNPVLPMNFSLPFTGEYKVGDLVLLGGDRGVGIRDCMIQQVQRINGSMLILGDNHTSGTGSTINFSDFAAPGMGTVYAAQIGYIVPTASVPPAPLPNPPLFQMFAVGDGAVLYSYDLLKTSTTAAQNQPQPVADNVVEVRALYGVDTDLDHTVNIWQDPGTAPFRYADLTDGSQAALTRLKQITAIRIGLILRSPLQEKLRSDNTPVAPESIVLFPGLSSGGVALEHTRVLTADERNFRYRTYEAIIPLRNMQFAPLP